MFNLIVMSEVKIQAKYKAYDCIIFLIINGLMLKKNITSKWCFFLKHNDV